jgi:hypothetical protein
VTAKDSLEIRSYGAMIAAEAKVQGELYIRFVGAENVGCDKPEAFRTAVALLPCMSGNGCARTSSPEKRDTNV